MPEEKIYYQVIQDHSPESHRVLNVKEGDVLSFERRLSGWKGWIWCEDHEGIGAWLPENWVSIEGESCVMLRDYISTELSVSPGEVLDVVEIESEWTFCRKSSGVFGWVPMSCLEREQ